MLRILLRREKYAITRILSCKYLSSVVSKNGEEAYTDNNTVVWGKEVKKIRDKISPLVLLCMICVAGIITGIVTMAFWQKNWLITEGILNRDFISKIEELMIDKRALFFLCLEKRLCAFFLLFLLAFSSVNILTNVCFFFLNGLYIGSILEVLTIRYGMQGTFMYLLFVFPQGIFYTMGYLILGCWCLSLVGNAKGQKNKKRDKVCQFAVKGRLLIALFFVFIGIVLESFVNLKLLKIIFWNLLYQCYWNKMCKLGGEKDVWFNEEGNDWKVIALFLCHQI